MKSYEQPPVLGIDLSKDLDTNTNYNKTPNKIE